MMAQYYVANPGPECDEYLESHPDRACYMKGAWNKLLTEAFLHARDPLGRDTEVYIETHKDREWLLQAAVKAKDLVENHSTAKADAYYAAQFELERFRKPAEFYFKPKQRDFGTPATTASTALAVQTPQPPEPSPHRAAVVECVRTTAPAVQQPRTPPKLTSGRAVTQTSDGSAAEKVGIHVIIASHSGALNPRDLLAQIEALVKRMLASSGGVSQSSVSVASDGVYLEEEVEKKKEVEEEDEEL